MRALLVVMLSAVTRTSLRADASGSGQAWPNATAGSNVTHNATGMRSMMLSLQAFAPTSAGANSYFELQNSQVTEIWPFSTM
jgi:hypothetical protein